MAQSEFIVRPERRPCWIDGKKAMFHQWINRAKVSAPSMMVGGHGGGQLWEVFGLVELEEGQMKEVYPTEVIFADGGDFSNVVFKPQEVDA